jgi:hypothetical protein
MDFSWEFPLWNDEYWEGRIGVPFLGISPIVSRLSLLPFLSLRHQIERIYMKPKYRRYWVLCNEQSLAPLVLNQQTRSKLAY